LQGFGEGMNLQAKIDRIKNNLDAESYTVAAGEAVKIIEIAFRKLLVDGLALLSDKARLKVMQAIIDIGKGEKGVGSFGLGQMLAVLRKSKFYDGWEASTGNDLSAIKMIDLDALNKIRIKLTHDAEEASKFEAEFLFHALEGVIQTFGIMSLEKQGSSVSSVDNITASHKTPSGKLQKNEQQSAKYSPTEYNEAKRLSIQGEYPFDVDMKAFKQALRMLPKKSELVALDVGCANGEITRSRFGAFSVFRKVIGVDADAKVIEQAKNEDSEGVFEYHQMNIADKDAESKLTHILEENEATGFDVIFSAFTLHFISNPVAVLRKLRKMLNKGGVIIIRGWDDDMTVAYPDKENLVSDIKEAVRTAPITSDIHCGRKLYHQTWKAGFRDIQIFHKIIDTSSMDIDARMDYFISAFSWRKNLFARFVETYPDQHEWAGKLAWIEEAIESLEVEFESEDFYFMELLTVAVGQKK